MTDMLCASRANPRRLKVKLRKLRVKAQVAVENIMIVVLNGRSLSKVEEVLVAVFRAHVVWITTGRIADSRSHPYAYLR